LRRRRWCRMGCDCGLSLAKPWLGGSLATLYGVPVPRAGAGSRPAASVFLLLRQKKGTKEKATLRAASLRFAAGNLWCSVVGCAAELAARCALRSNNRSESEHEACVLRHTPPHALRSSAHPEGTGCGHPHGPSLRWAERSGGPKGCWLLGSPSPLAAPAAGRLRGGTRVGARVLRCLARRSCLNEAPTARSEFCGPPRKRPAAGLPLRTAKGSQTGGRLFFANFLLAKQKKVSRPPGRQPGSRPPIRHTAPTSERAPASTSRARTVMRTTHHAAPLAPHAA